MCLRAELGAVVADKTVLKMMREMGIRCGIRRRGSRRRYSSYRGLVGSTFENVIARDFGAEGPWQKLGTDVTEFKVAGAKAYWAPVLDFCTKEIVASDISTSPDLAQQHRMLDRLLEALPDGAAPTMHSDMGWQYQHESYTSRLEGAGITQSMSRKGNCIDNAATEQLFGHVKDEFYRGREWGSFEDFKRDLEGYIVHWNTRRRQVRLKGLTPEEFRNRALVQSKFRGAVHRHLCGGFPLWWFQVYSLYSLRSLDKQHVREQGAHAHRSKYQCHDRNHAIDHVHVGPIRKEPIFGGVDARLTDVKCPCIHVYLPGFSFAHR